MYDRTEKVVSRRDCKIKADERPWHDDHIQTDAFFPIPPVAAHAEGLRSGMHDLDRSGEARA